MGRSYRYSWLIAGLTLFFLMALVAWLSPHFQFERSVSRMPVLWVVTALVLAGTVFTALTTVIQRTNPDWKLMCWVVLIGLALRLVLIPSTPILEDDFYRYLWDGAVVSEGFNPYEIAPYEALAGKGPPELTELARNTPLITERINHPELTTVYPPVAEMGFMVSHWIKPWSLFAWKVILLLADGITLGLLLTILKHLGRSPLWVVVYWWNPLVTKEFFNSGHVDALMIPLVLGALLLTLRRRSVSASTCLALAAGVKLWPVLLWPVVLKAGTAKWRTRTLCVFVFLTIMAVQSIPILAGSMGETSGFLTYARIWEMNDASFMIIAWVVARLGDGFAMPGQWAGVVARLVAGLMVVAVVGFVCVRDRLDDDRLVVAFLAITAAVFLLSPTQFPWYYAWLVPFLALRPCFALLLLTPLLGLYYSRFYFDARGQVEVFDFGVVWLEYVPVWVLLAWYGLKRLRQG